MSIYQQSNQDLIWDLGADYLRTKAKDFVLNFEGRMCVYSKSVRQLYSNYTMHMPAQQDRNLVILPDPYAFHDTFNHVDSNAISQTSMFIVPGEFARKEGFFLRVPTRDRKSRLIPLHEAVKHFIKANKDEPFLPVLVKGDLKPFKNRIPYLHLHRINPMKLRTLSRFVIKDMQNTIIKRLEELAELSFHPACAA